jgi:hypothetical protein
VKIKRIKNKIKANTNIDKSKKKILKRITDKIGKRISNSDSKESSNKE